MERNPAQQQDRMPPPPPPPHHSVNVTIQPQWPQRLRDFFHGYPITILDLSYCGAVSDQEVVRAIGTAIHTNATLLRISLRGTDVRELGGIAIAQGLAINSTLLHLDLHSCCCVGNGAAMALGIALRINNTLQNLNLGDTGVWDEGGAAIAEGLAHNTGLTDLDLSNCEGVGDETGKAIGATLLTNVTLRYLRLTRTGVTEEGGKAIADGLMHNTAILSINVIRTLMSDEQQDRLHKLAADLRARRALLVKPATGGMRDSQRSEG